MAPISDESWRLISSSFAVLASHRLGVRHENNTTFKSYVMTQVFVAVPVKVVAWDAMPCSLVDVY